MAMRSVPHTTACGANGDVGVLLFRPGTGNPGPSEIARVCKYALLYGSSGAGGPKIQRQIWRDAVLGYDEQCGEKAICTNLLNTTVSRRMSSKSDRMVAAAKLPLLGRSWKFRQVSLSGFRKIQVEGETGTHTTPLDKYSGRPAEDAQISLYGGA